MQMFTLYRVIYVEWGRNGGGMGANKYQFIFKKICWFSYEIIDLTAT